MECQQTERDKITESSSDRFNSSVFQWGINVGHVMCHNLKCKKFVLQIRKASKWQNTLQIPENNTRTKMPSGEKSVLVILSTDDKWCWSFMLLCFSCHIFVTLLQQQMENAEAERDIYDELLTQAEIQGNVNKVNGRSRTHAHTHTHTHINCRFLYLCHSRGTAVKYQPFPHSEQRLECSWTGFAERRWEQVIWGPESDGHPEPAGSEQSLVPQTAAGWPRE